jgi:DNA helicase-2/ATP-dependent DNA helicase PcrA
VISAAQIATELGLPRPTDEQAAVVEAPLEPMLVVAGAGSGKTETMSARVVWLVANGLVQPEQVLGLTFTRKAAGELAERVRARLWALGRRGGGDRRMFLSPTVSTYHSYAAALVGDHALRLGLEPSARLIGEAARWQLAHELVERWAGDLDTPLAPTTVTAAVLDLADALAEHLVGPDALRCEAERLVEAIADAPEVAGMKAADRGLLRDVAASLALRARLVDVVEAFTERKREGDLIDFADQVALAARVAKQVPEVGAGERARFPVVLLDEYQDTSVAQLVLLRHLFGAETGSGHAVTAVGDPHQSIYGWRGASAGGLERFPEQFPRQTPGGPVAAHVRALSVSWRNDTGILALANALAEPLRSDSRIDLPVLQAGPAAGPGQAVVHFGLDLADEAASVARFVADRRAALGTAGRPASAAVLCRRRAQFDALELALREAGLPVEVVGLGGLLTSPEVVELVAALEAAHDPSRGDSLMRLLTGPRARLGLADVQALADWSAALADRERYRTGDGSEPDVVDERSIVDALDVLPAPGWTSGHGRSLSAEGRARLQELGGDLRTLRAHTFLPVADLVAEAEVLLGLDIEVAVGPQSPAAARAHLDAFRGVAARFDTDEGGTLGAFLAWLDAAKAEERGLEAPVAEMDPEAVQLLTVHAAKGLEWDVVAVPGMVEKSFPVGPAPQGWVKERGSLPTRLRGDRDSLPDVDLTGVPQDVLVRRLSDYKDAVAAHALAEERRLVYVAATRARHALLLSGSWWREGKRETPPSVFLSEVMAAGLAQPEAWVTEAGPRAEPPAVVPPVWPPAAALGPRTARVAAAAAAVRAAAPTSQWEGADAAGAELAALATVLLDERARLRQRRAVSLPAHLSTSALVRLASEPEEFALALRRPVPTAPSTVARRGTAFHAWVERYFGAAALVDVDAMPGADDASVSEDPELAVLRERFLASEWARRAPSHVEVDVETPVGELVVRSRIDAVFPEPDGGVVVVDWKTGAVPGPEAMRERALQLAVYRLAWSRWSGLPPGRVSAAFVYVAHGVTVRPEDLPGADELADLVAAGRRPARA